MSALATQARVLTGYRTLIKSIYRCFKDDQKMLSAALTHTRNVTNGFRNLDETKEEDRRKIETGIALCYSVSHELDTKVIQAVAKDESSPYALQIRQTTELENSPPIKKKCSNSNNNKTIVIKKQQ